MNWPTKLTVTIIAAIIAVTSPTSADELHWSFRKITRPTPPRVRQSDWLRNGSDSFVLARLEKENVAPSQEADRVTLIRRVTLDLIGLPPTPEEVAEFVRDETRCLRAVGGSAARVAALRGAVGSAVARSVSLRRQRRAFDRSIAAGRVAVSRLGHADAQREFAV